MRIFFVLIIMAGLLGCDIEVNSREDYDPSEIKTLTFVEPAKDITSVNYRISMAAGELEVVSGSDSLFQADIEYTNDIMKPVYSLESFGNGTNVIIKHNKETKKNNIGYNKWEIALNSQIESTLNLELGLGKSEINLMDVNLKDVKIEMGLGEAILKIDSDYLQDIDIEVTGGIGKLTVYLPLDTRIEAEFEKGIGSLEAADWVKENDNYYNPNARKEGPVVRLKVTCGIGEIEIKYLDLV